MHVTEVARRAGLSARTVRFYEAAGVIPPARRGGNRYREYGEDDVCRLRLVASLRALGLPLDESGRFAGMCADGRCDDMGAQLLIRIADRRAELAAARAELDHLDAELGRLERTLRDGGSSESLCLSERRTDAS